MEGRSAASDGIADVLYGAQCEFDDNDELLRRPNNDINDKFRAFVSSASCPLSSSYGLSLCSHSSAPFTKKILFKSSYDIASWHLD